MVLRDIIRLTRQNIRSNRLRANLTVAVIAIGITALISIVTIIRILENSLRDNLTFMGANTFAIRHRSILGNQKETPQPISFQEASFFKQNYSGRGIVSISVIGSREAILKTRIKESHPNSLVFGVDENYLSISGAKISEGRFFTQEQALSSQNLCIIGNQIAESYFKGQNPLGKYIYIDRLQYSVIGVLESKGSSLIDKTDMMVFIPLENARHRFDLSGNSYVTSVKVTDQNTMGLAMDEAEGLMRRIRKRKPKDESNFSIENNKALASMMVENLESVGIVGAAIGFITLLSAAIGLMNIMLVAVSERTKEIGLSKAIGASNRTIKRQFIWESVYISLKGGFLGILIGILLGNILSIFLKGGFTVPWPWILFGLLSCLFVGLLSGIYPALKAARLNPIESLRYE